MKTQAKIITVFFCLTSLTACTTFDNHYTRYPSPTYSYTTTAYYQPGDALYYQQKAESHSDVMVLPGNYPVETYHSPTPHKEMDRNWIKAQNPNGYTIEMADSDKPAQVAKKLYKAPKKDRMAEIKYYRDGKAYFKGVYGSYNNYDEAKKALENLPPELKQGAGIKNWNKIQNHVETY